MKRSQLSAVKSRKCLSHKNLRDIHKSFVSVGIPVILETSIKAEYSSTEIQMVRSIQHYSTGKSTLKA